MKVFYPAFESNYIPPFRVQGKLLNTFFETPKRLQEILKYFENSADRYELVKIASIGIENIGKVHSQDLIMFYSKLQKILGKGEYVEAIVYPLQKGQKPQNIRYLAGYYCFDSRTVLKKETIKAALNAGTATIKAAMELVNSVEQHVLALVRPPGHHAGKNFYGGYSYINNAALAADILTKLGRVAVIDIDYFHGNGTQDIFYNSSRVFTISIHRTPEREFPYYWGYINERGRGKGEGWNVNIPLDGTVNGSKYLKIMEKVIKLISKADVKGVVVSFGSNIHRHDEQGTFDIDTEYFEKIGSLVASLGVKTITVLEGGYNPRILKESLLSYLEGIYG